METRFGLGRKRSIPRSFPLDMRKARLENMVSEVIQVVKRFFSNLQ